MILTGKSGESFRKYFSEHYEYDNASYRDLRPGMSVMEGFFRMPLSMQFGVYVDWLDSEGIELMITFNDQMQFTYSINGKPSSLKEGFSTRSAARRAALERANAFFNLKQERGRRERHNA